MDERSSTTVALLADVQAKLDAYPYPPTMRYEVAKLKPTGPLYERCKKILSVCPQFFSAPSFLDVGASKGFFSLRAAAEGTKRVLAIDPDPEALAIWEPVKQENVEQRVTAFKDADFGGEKFEVVWIGNGPHYLYREDIDWTDRMAGICSTLLVMEGPVGRVCRDIKDWVCVQEERDMIKRLCLGFKAPFKLAARKDSPTYTPNRAIWFLVRN